jgi:hypothetical protein
MRETSELVPSNRVSFPTDGFLERIDRHDGTVQVLKSRVAIENSGIVGFEQDAGVHFESSATSIFIPEIHEENEIQRKI